MEVITLLLLLGLLIAAAMILFPHITTRARTVHLINRLPGPPSYPILGTSLPFILAPRRDVMRIASEMADKYKPLFRTWFGVLPQVNLTKPEHIEVVLSSSLNLNKAYFYKFLHPWLGTGLVTATGQKWHTHRKMITPAFHFTILESFVEVFSEKSEILISKLQKEVGSQGFDVYPYITKCALDIICETAMGTPFHAQDDTNPEIVAAVHDITDLWQYRIFRPWLYPNWIWWLTSLGRRHEECLKILHGFRNKVIQKRKELHAQTQKESGNSTTDKNIAQGKKRRLAFLDLLLEASHDGVNLTDEELREEVDTFIFGGHHTISSGVCWALFLLGLHVDVQNKAHEELDHIFQGSDRSATMKDLNEMKFLERVIKESLRLYPSVPTIARDITSEIKIDEYVIPAGVMMLIMINHVHRNPDQFPNPENFDPDNFLPERVAKRHPYAYIPFSAGPRNCIGQKFALLEMKTMLSSILRHYEVRSLDNREDVTLISELVMTSETGFQIIITPRN